MLRSYGIPNPTRVAASKVMNSISLCSKFSSCTSTYTTTCIRLRGRPSSLSCVCTVYKKGAFSPLTFKMDGNYEDV